MILRSLAVSSFLISTVALAQSVAFDLQAGTRSVGKDTFSISPAKNGFKLASRYSYHAKGGDADASNEFKYTAEYAFIEGTSQSSSSRMLVSFSANKPKTVLTVAIMQSGAQDSKQLPIRPDFVLLPNYDAGAAQAVLTQAVTHAAAGNQYSVIVPAMGAPATRAGEADPDANQVQSRTQKSDDMAYDAKWARSGDVTGTLDGKPVTVHVYTMTAGSYVWTFLADDANALMQLNNSLIQASYVRAKFKLDAAK